MKLIQSEQTLVTLANASDLVRNVAQGVVGNEIADTFNGSHLSTGVLHQLAQVRFQAALSKQIGSN